jgi:hypothetical protein
MSKLITALPPGTIFVFGSNLAGRHGKGAALTARKNFGAVSGVGAGPTGQAYAIPTKDKLLNSLPLHRISLYVSGFLNYAWERPDTNFFVTAIGTGLAGYQHRVIAPMFCNAPSNCLLPDEWDEYLNAMLLFR